MNRIGATLASPIRSLAAIAFAIAAATSHADVWDKQTANDNSTDTRQELIHGTNEQHDLAARLLGSQAFADQDWFKLAQKARASYEVVIERVSGDACPANLARIAADGFTTLQTSEGVGHGCTRSLRWTTGAAAVASQYIRVDSDTCGTQCGADDVYRLRAYETTYAIPRFNNTGSQVSVLIVQNTSDARIAGTVDFWRADGTIAASQAFVLNPRASLVLNTSVLVPNVSGSVTVANDGRYGALTGKMVALEPATGFSFDTQMEPRPL